jgi:hypothetical protein
MVACCLCNSWYCGGIPWRGLGYGVSVSHRMMPSNIISMSIGSVSALVLCLRSESRNLFRQSDLALHLRNWVWSSTGCWQDWHPLGYSVALYLATVFPVASHPCRNLRRKIGGDLVRLSLQCAYVQELTACLWPAQSIPWVVVSVHLYFVCMWLKIAFSHSTSGAMHLCLLPMT